MKASIHPTAVVDPSAELAEGVEIGPYAVVGRESRLGRGTTVGAHAVIGPHTTLGESNRVFPHACVGLDPQDLKYKGEKSLLVVGDDNTFREFCTLNRGCGEGNATRVGSHNLMMAYSHVGHDCVLGSHLVLANSVALAGHVVVEDHVGIGGLVGVHQFCHVGEHCMIGGGAMVSKDVVPYVMVSGDIPQLFGLNLVGLKRAGFGRDVIRVLEEAYRTLFRSNLNTSQALAALAGAASQSPQVAHLVEFIKGSERGIQK